MRKQARKPTNGDYVFAPHERPTMPGSPYAPSHPIRRKVGYVIVALIMAMAASLSNAIVSVNTQPLAGAMGVTATEVTWLLAVYVAFNASANLLLIKARMQFGIPPVMRALLWPYIVLVFSELLWPSFSLAIVARAAGGFLAAGMSSLVIYNLMQVFPAKFRPLAIVFAVGLPQLATPIARLLPVEQLLVNGQQTIHMIELGLALAASAGANLVRLPPTDKVPVFDPLDALTFALFLQAMLLLSVSLVMGRSLWWTDTPWLGWALAVSVVLFFLVGFIEYKRANPLLHLRWIGSRDILRFCIVAMLVRLALSEQTYGTLGLLTVGGLNNDQLHGLFAVILFAMIGGTLASAVLLKATRTPYMIIAASLIIALGAWLDSFSSSLTRPPQLYLSQAILAFGSTFFIGPALLFGFGKVLEQGKGFIVSFSVMFGLSQNIGGLAGSALLSTYQVIQARAHSQSMYSHLLAGDPAVAARVQGGITSLAQVVSREANVAAFNDVARLVMVIAILTAVYIAYLIILKRLADRKQALAPSSPTAKAAV
ncbi:MFS transporter [Asticcacaulis taihuensis]|uniref:MFS transporter n=1 Tax=Asticcacaulis taihuensis TaxID=260084 RepID=UPI0026ED8773|nr:MFS transporter [Asticcacaulis taihuensis]